MAGLGAMTELLSSDGTMDLVILLSDGILTEELIDHNTSPIYEHMANIRHDQGSTWLLYTVGLGKFDTRHLKQLANIGGGEFYESANATTLQKTFTRLSVSVTTLRGTVMA